VRGKLNEKKHRSMCLEGIREHMLDKVLNTRVVGVVRPVGLGC
jgi:hypothetical protein